MFTVRTAHCGDAKELDRLADIAMGGRPPLQQKATPLSTIVERHGGEIAAKPFGRARAVVCELEPGASICGLVFVVPPGRLILEHAAQGVSAQRTLAAALAEIDLLAVDDGVRGRGIGSALLEEAERWLEGQGCRVLIAKIARGDYRAMRWYRQRGYLVAAQGEPLWVTFPHLDLRCDDGNDGYHLAVKGLGRVSLRRARMGAQTYLTVENRNAH
ncbi:GNAT family N-acetyltransferase [Streptomyces salinarius]|uniref:GNAT family N-acetyltransferase n=1 Tax=Streptomyces salinarius TaxID=2762598 RepID=UPI0032DFEC83